MELRHKKEADAKLLIRAWRAHDKTAYQRLHAVCGHQRRYRHHHAQRTVVHEAGFSSWDAMAVKSKDLAYAAWLDCMLPEDRQAVEDGLLVIERISAGPVVGRLVRPPRDRAA